MNIHNPLHYLIIIGCILMGYSLLIKIKKPNKKNLIKLLDKAEKLVSEYSGGYSGIFLSAEEFHKALKLSIEQFKNGDNSKLDEFYIWFAPTSAWDDFVGSEGENLANQIFEIVESLKARNN
jgi:hypothetical protein